MSAHELDPNAIAVVALCGRFPGAPDVESLWRRLEAGEELLTFFDDAELLEAGVDPSLLRRSDYVRSWGVLDGTELFDAAFFGMTPREAELTDPQQRLFLECAWEALESAGYVPERCPGTVGVFAGAAASLYALELAAAGVDVDDLPGLIASEKDFLATRVAYRLDLRGPALSVQTACSTSLVAVHLACQSLLGKECDVALAGGVSVRLLRKRGYLFQEGGIGSPDGHCRAFDAAAQGTVGGDGVGVVVLRRLEDALAGGDHVRAVIRGSAINNDGASKVGFTAPSVDGQARVIAEALAMAGVEPDSVGYVEAHGTGTALGDPIEVAALMQAFGGAGGRARSCALGSIKTNLGHLDAAAGVTGLIKAVLCLERGRLPPSLHFERPNPAIDFEAGPFHVNARAADWPTANGPRRAGVSSFGIGGTNAHVVLEQAPLLEPAPPARPWQVLLLSARTEAALDAATARLGRRLAESDVELCDAAYTLALGRRHFPHRRALVCRDLDDARGVLGEPSRARLWSRHAEGAGRAVAFLFPGQGAQRAGMGAQVYATEAVFRDELERCAEILRPLLGAELRDVLDLHGRGGVSAAQLDQTAFTQPALFACSYALARVFMAWGLHPVAMLGHSVGEYVAACLAQVFTLEQALRVVVVRARLMQALPRGAMLAVPLPEQALRARLDAQLDVAAVNGPARSVVSGPEPAVAALEARLAQEGVSTRRLVTSHAFHSSMMDPILEPLRRELEGLALRPPRIPFISSVSGTWIGDDEATDPAYWSRQAREAVRFGDGARALLEHEARPLLLELGPGRTLSGLAAAQAAGESWRIVAALDPRAPDERAALLEAAARAWLCGVELDWEALHAAQPRRRVNLPTYPFERQRYWIVGRGGARPSVAAPATPATAPTAAPETVIDVLARHVASVRHALGAPATSAPAVRVAPRVPPDDVPATPIQHWFLRASRRPHHFNQSLLLALRRPLAVERLEQALRRLVERHDALRLRAVPEGGTWRLRSAPSEDQVRVDLVRFEGRAAGDRTLRLARGAAELQRGLHLTHGPLLRARLFDFGPDHAGRLLLVAHHLVVDVLSWDILCAELELACRDGEQVLPPPGTPFTHWARRLERHAREGGFDAERGLWLELAELPPRALPLDHYSGRDDVAGEASLTLELERTPTQAVLAAARRHRTQVAALLLAGLAHAVRDTCGLATTLVDLEGHGREPLFDECDPARSVGWFTALVPLALEARGDVRATLDAVAARLRALPHGGLGFGALRYLGPDLATRARLAALPRPEIVFNYRGRSERGLEGSELFASTRDDSGPDRDPDDRRTHRLAFDASVVEGRLRLECRYSRALHEPARIHALVSGTLAALDTLDSPAAERTAEAPLPLERM